MKNKVAVVGAGISGLSIANVLSEKKYDVTVFESSSKVGGLVKCDIVDGVLFHRVGGHVFNTKNKEVNDWFWNKFNRDSEFLSAERNAKIHILNKTVGYPIESYLHQLPQEVTTKIISDFLTIAKSDTLKSEDFDSFLRTNFGKTLYELYFRPYNAKIWNVPLDSIPLPWLDGKLPMPRLLETLLSNIYRNSENEMVHSTFFYPKTGGSQFIADKLARTLKIHLSSPIKELKIIKGSGILIEEQYFDHLIYSGDVRMLPSMLKGIQIDTQLIESITKLRSNGTSNVLCEIDKTTLSWQYLPEEDIAAHRIIYTGNFSGSNNGEKKRLTCTIEFSGIHSEEFIMNHLKKIPGNPTPIAFNVEKKSYVIQNHSTRADIAKFKDVLNKYNISLLGRFAEWEYYNMDKAIEAAFILSDEKF